MKRFIAVLLFVGLLSGCATVQRDVNSELNELRERVVHLERNDVDLQKIIGAIIMELSKPSKNGVPATY